MERKLAEPPASGGLVWISVEHELPDSNISVLIWGPSMDEPFIGYYEDGDWYTMHGERLLMTHWMDLPQTPGTWADQASHLVASIEQLVQSKQLRSRDDMDAAAAKLRQLADTIDNMDLAIDFV